MSNQKVLVLAAHPDDETLGAGATIAKLSSEGKEVKLITFTDGISARGQNLKNRNKSLDKVSEILGISDYSVGNFPDNEMDSVSMLKVCKFIESSVDFTPDMIFTHQKNCLNVDHQTVYRAALTVFRPQYGHQVKFMSFPVLSSTDYNPGNNFAPNIFYDVENWVSLKMKALKVYDSEMRPYPHSRSYENVINTMKANGSSVGINYAECFELVRMIVR